MVSEKDRSDRKEQNTWGRPHATRARAYPSLLPHLITPHYHAWYLHPKQLYQGRRSSYRSEMAKAALWFPDDANLQKALEALEELASVQHVEYDVVAGSSAIVLPRWAQARLTPLLEKKDVKFKDIPVRSLSSLPPEEQARLRGLMWRKD